MTLARASRPKKWYRVASDARGHQRVILMRIHLSDPEGSVHHRLFQRRHFDVGAHFFARAPGPAGTLGERCPVSLVP